MANTFTGLKLQGELGRFGTTELTDIEGNITTTRIFISTLSLRPTLLWDVKKLGLGFEISTYKPIRLVGQWLEHGLERRGPRLDSHRGQANFSLTSAWLPLGELTNINIYFYH